MKLKISLLMLLAFAAYAGTRAAESNGAVPASSTAGVSLSSVESCRFSVRTDAGTINSGTLVSYYYDAVLGWVRSPTALDCVLESNKLIDGGKPSAQVCPDTEVLAPFGRVAVANSGVAVVTADGGSGTAVFRVECFGKNIP